MVLFFAIDENGVHFDENLKPGRQKWCLSDKRINNIKLMINDHHRIDHMLHCKRSSCQRVNATLCQEAADHFNRKACSIVCKCVMSEVHNANQSYVCDILYIGQVLIVAKLTYWQHEVLSLQKYGQHINMPYIRNLKCMNL